MKELAYYLVVYPIEYLIEFVFTLVYQMIGSLGYSILAVSIVISFLVLPMYRRSDEIQEEERKQQERMSYWTRHIRRGFAGDERTMLLTEYYRQCGYRPYYALRGSVSLLLQIPFFLAAYHFLSHLELLQGASFHFIRDLGAPDGMLTLGGVSINVLPVLMTAINIVSGAVYTRGFPLSQKLQLYGMALVFLVVLYGSPAGLVLYWTMNNLFSLGKNIFLKRLRDPERIFAIGAAAAGWLYLAAMFLRGKLYTPDITVFSVLLTLLCQLPLLLRLRRRMAARSGRGDAGVSSRKAGPTAGRAPLAQYLVSALGLALLIGGMIPLSVIASSPEDFLVIGLDNDPLRMVWYPFFTSLGLFALWGGVAWYLMDEGGRDRWSALVFGLLLAALVDHLTITEGTKSLSPLFEVWGWPERFSLASLALNFLLLAAVAAAAGYLAGHRAMRLRVGLLFLVSISISCGWSIRTANARLSAATYTAKGTGTEGEPTLRLSRMGHNVVVIMLDRAINRFAPYILEELPQVREQFAGFTLYENALSFGNHTNFGMPALFGGYDYTPSAMNARPELSLAEKHNEALKLLPALFSGAGYGATVFNPTYAGYREVPDLSIYDDQPSVRVFFTKGAHAADYAGYLEAYHDTQRHHIFGYGLLRVLPLAVRRWFYDSGYYWGVERYKSSEATGLEMRGDYADLDKLPESTELVDDGPGEYTMFVNELTHDKDVLQMPGYVPSDAIDSERSRSYFESLPVVTEGRLRMEDETFHMMHYASNAAALIKLGEWMDFLRGEGVYDNTRIIIASDHGRADVVFNDMVMPGGVDVQAFNPLLLVKDFGAAGDFRVSQEFRTNGDVPAMAMEGLVESPVNPWTGNLVTADRRQEVQLVTDSELHSVMKNNGNVFDTSDGRWYAVTPGDICDPGNWEVRGDG